MILGKSKAQSSEDRKVVQYSTIKARLYPNREQTELFENMFGCCRYIWNRLLADQQRFYLETDKHFIPTPAKYKKEVPFLKEVDNQALTQEYNKLAQAFRVFFKSPETFGCPKFKKKKTDRDSFIGLVWIYRAVTLRNTAGGTRCTSCAKLMWSKLYSL